jgi:hypothetical protein
VATASTGVLLKAVGLVGTEGLEELVADTLTLWVFVASKRIGLDTPFPDASIE